MQKVALLLAALLFSAVALAAPRNECLMFERNPDGTWTALETVVVGGPTGEFEVEAGLSFSRGVDFNGVDLAQYLDETCAALGEPSTGPTTYHIQKSPTKV